MPFEISGPNSLEPVLTGSGRACAVNRAPHAKRTPWFILVQCIASLHSAYTVRMELSSLAEPLSPASGLSARTEQRPLQSNPNFDVQEAEVRSAHIQLHDMVSANQ